MFLCCVEKFEVTTLVCNGHEVLVGTSIGVVYIFHSETTDLLQRLDWHTGSVLSLFTMPREVDPCICAEIPFPGGMTNCGNETDLEPGSPLVISFGFGKKECHKEKGSSETIVCLTWRLGSCEQTLIIL